MASRTLGVAVAVAALAAAGAAPAQLDPLRSAMLEQVEALDAATSISAAHTSAGAIETWQMSLTKTGVDTALLFAWMVRHEKRGDAGNIVYGFVGEIERTSADPRGRD